METDYRTSDPLGKQKSVGSAGFRSSEQKARTVPGYHQTQQDLYQSKQMKLSMNCGMNPNLVTAQPELDTL